MIDNIELNKQLCAEMPYLLPRNLWTDEVSDDYDYSHIRGDYELPDGWIKMFIQMCKDIRQPLIDAHSLNTFRFSQIKEKYGTMRCYTFGASPEVQEIIAKYEYISRYVCAHCGKPATVETQGYILSYCDECHKAHDVGYITDPIKFKPTYIRKYYYKGNTTKEVIDCSDEWRRLYE